MSAPPYMKLYVAEYLAETTHLSAPEHGAYLLLLMAMWRAGGKLPRDQVKLGKIARCTPDQWAEIAPNVLAFFKVAGGSIKHRRIAKELAKYQAIVDAASEAGKASVSQKRRKNNAKAGDSVERNFNQPEPESSTEGINPSVSTRRERSEARQDGASGFRVIEGGEAEAWRQALAEAQHDLPHFNRTDPDYASEIAEFIEVALAKLESMAVAA